ncbi:RDD family protein [Evansella halocellulosilytica]|uniref:RDD family protein n=1 Tax=Evansella halocellulosilytica TaxID=2011013 RepID=UPI000BB90E7E|nr:RDD family protein [Evansella halocellulosilytica]
MKIENATGLGIRLLASFLDFIILVIPISFIIFIFNGHYSYEWTLSFSWQIVYVLYLTIVPVLWGGYIIGKRICKIKIKRVDNQNVTFLNMFLREVVGSYLIVLLTFGLSLVVSIFMILFREDKRGVHDIIGGTYVTRQGGKENGKDIKREIN